MYICGMSHGPSAYAELPCLIGHNCRNSDGGFFSKTSAMMGDCCGYIVVVVGCIVAKFAIWIMSPAIILKHSA